MLFGFSASGTIEVGVLYAFISYLGRLNEPLIELTTQQAMLQQAVVAGERVFELMDGPRSNMAMMSARYRVAPSKSITCHLLIAMTIWC